VGEDLGIVVVVERGATRVALVGDLLLEHLDLGQQGISSLAPEIGASDAAVFAAMVKVGAMVTDLDNIVATHPAQYVGIYGTNAEPDLYLFNSQNKGESPLGAHVEVLLAEVMATLVGTTYAERAGIPAADGVQEIINAFKISDIDSFTSAQPNPSIAQQIYNGLENFERGAGVVGEYTMLLRFGVTNANELPARISTLLSQVQMFATPGITIDVGTRYIDAQNNRVYFVAVQGTRSVIFWVPLVMEDVHTETIHVINVAQASTFDAQWFTTNVIQEPDPTKLAQNLATLSENMNQQFSGGDISFEEIFEALH
jgi:hypothetical protein